MHVPHLRPLSHAVLLATNLMACENEAEDPPDPEDTEVIDTAPDSGPRSYRHRDDDGDGYTIAKGDCNDWVATVFPDAPEICDGYVNDCIAGTPLDEEGLVTVDGRTNFPTLMEALTSTPDGVIYDICQGRHPLTVDLDRDLTLRGHLVPDQDYGDWPSLVVTGAVPRSTVHVHHATVDIIQLNIEPGGGTTLSNGDIIGGAVLVRDLGKLELLGVRVESGYATNGGGIAVMSAQLSLINGSISGATATEQGGCLYIDGGLVTINQTQFLDCTADRGGGIAVDLRGTVVADGAVLQDNRARTGGGVYLGGGAKIEGDSLSVNYNEASETGGGIAIVGSGVVLAPSRLGINYNVTSGLGGGIHLSDNADLLIDDINITRNTAERGGGFFVDPSSRLALNGGTVEHNSAAHTGGGVHVDGGMLTATGTNFELNRIWLPPSGPNPSGSGGGVFGANGASLVLQGVHISTGSSFGALGIGAAVEGSEILVADADIDGNGGAGIMSLRFGSTGTFYRVTPSGDVGTLYTITDSTVVDRGGLIENLSSPNPMAVVHHGGVLVLNGTTLRGNHDTFVRDPGPMLLHPGGQIVVQRADLGEGADDNSPFDIVFAGMTVGWSGGSDVSGSCSGTTASCETLP
jgi:hypothetical protein